MPTRPQPHPDDGEGPAGSGAAGPEPSGPSGRPLVVCGDETLLDDLLRLAAAAGVDPVVAVDPGSARGAWVGAPFVLVGGDQAEACAAARLPRRPRSALVTRDHDDADVWRRAVALGAEHVFVLPDGEAWLVEALADAVEGPGRGRVVCVVGGRGGAGASTLAVALAFAGLRAGQRVVLVDGDPLGGGIDLVLGAEDAPGLRWPDLASTRGRLAGQDLTGALPEVQQLVVLSWDRGDLLEIPAMAMESVLGGARSAADLVVVDLPRRPDEPSEVALSLSDAAYLVVPAEVRAVASAGRVVARVGELAPRLEVVVRGPSPGGLDADVVASALGLPLAGWCRAEPGIAAALERGDAPGRWRGPLARLTDRLLADLDRRPDLGRVAPSTG